MNGFGSYSKYNIDEIIKKLEKQISNIKIDYSRDVVVLKNQLSSCAAELEQLKIIVNHVDEYTQQEYNKLNEKLNYLNDEIEDIKTKLNTIQYNEILGGKCASGINEFPIYARYAEKDTNGNIIPDYYAAKSDLSSVSSTLSADYTEKIAESSSIGMSALSSVSGILTTNLERETQERSEADIIIKNSIVSETTRALQSESNLNTKIDEEISRSTNKDTILEQKITFEQNRAETAESNLQESLSNETSRATEAENELLTNLNGEIKRATDIETGLRTDLDKEISRAIESETTIKTTLQENIDKEETRATNAENALQRNIDSEAKLRETNDNTIQTNLSNEITRAINTEKTERESDIEELNANKQNNLTAGDGISISNDVISHSIKIIENNNEEDKVEGTTFTVYLKNNHYKIITFDKTITSIKFIIESSTNNVLQETGFEFTCPDESELEQINFEVKDNPNKKIYTILPDSYTGLNIYQGTIVNYKCTIGEYEVED